MVSEYGIDSTAHLNTAQDQRNDMATETELLPPNVVPKSQAAPTVNGKDNEAPQAEDWSHGLKSKWPIAMDLAGSNLPCRLEGEIEDLVRIPSPRHLQLQDVTC